VSAPTSASPVSMPYAPGTVLAGKYRIDRLLGEGGMGWVVVATHLQLEQRVALKFMRSSQANSSPEAVGRFLREARAAARIQSEHVARVSDVGTLDDGAPYLVMEYLEGQDLDSLLQSTPKLSIGTAIEYAIQACEGLGEVHAAGIIHRDLKPANLFLARRSDESVRVKLLDFGISKISAAPGSQEGAMTSTQALMGSPLYMAPEQMRSSKSVDARADIWSMGVILYEMLAGASPFGGDTLPEVCARIMAEPPGPLRELRPEVPPVLESIVTRCLEKEPAKRFQDVAELAQALAPFGEPEAKSAADRIGRVMRKTQPSSVDLRSGSVTSTTANRARTSAVSPVARTAAEFGTTEPTVLPRRRGLSWIAGGVAAAIAVAIAIASTRGSHDVPPPVAPSAAAAPPSVAAPPAVSPASTAARQTSEPTAAPASPPEEPAASSPGPASSASAKVQVDAVPSAAAHGGHAKSKAAAAVAPVPATPKPAAPATAKPAATNDFGGRD
jgi:eukaryotic-like serine/threonine-protein kinase